MKVHLSPLFPLFALLLLFAAVSVGAEPESKPKSLSAKDLTRITQELIALDEFRDNEFIYDDKLAAFQDNVTQYKGATVRLVLTVARVQRDRVHTNTPFPRGTSSQVDRRSAKLVFVKGDPVQHLQDNTVGGTDTTPFGYISLKVGEVLNVELAKVLRRGNSISVEGEVSSILVSERLTFVISNPQVALLTADEVAQQAETSKATSVVNVPKPYIRYATSLIQEYDKDSDQVLNEEEWSKMKKSPAQADTNGDGKITAQELATFKFKGG